MEKSNHQYPSGASGRWKHSKLQLTICQLILAFALACDRVTCASELLASTYDGTNNDGCAFFIVGYDSLTPYTFGEGAKFTINGDGNFGLRRMVLSLLNSGADANNYRLSIVGDNNNNPTDGEVVWSGSPQGVGTVVGNYSFAVSGVVRGGEDYWVLFEPIANDNGSYWWAFSSSPIIPLCGHGEQRDSGFVAERWSTNGPPTMRWFISTNDIRPAFVLEGKRLPEPDIAISPVSKFFSLTNPVVLAPNNLGATVVLNGSSTTNPSGEPLLFQWLDGTNRLATTKIATNILDVGLHLITLRVFDGPDSVSATTVIEILTPGQATGLLIPMVEQSDLSELKSAGLTAVLASAENSFNSRRVIPAVNQLRAFQNELQARFASVDPWAVRLLNAAAQEIINIVNAPY